MWHMQMSHILLVFTLVRIAIQFLPAVYWHDLADTLANAQARESANIHTLHTPNT